MTQEVCAIDKNLLSVHTIYTPPKALCTGNVSLTMDPSGFSLKTLFTPSSGPHPCNHNTRETEGGAWAL